jgi:hypothetical protein
MEFATHNLAFSYGPYCNTSCQINGSTSGARLSYTFNSSTNQVTNFGRHLSYRLPTCCSSIRE